MSPSPFREDPSMIKKLTILAAGLSAALLLTVAAATGGETAPAAAASSDLDGAMLYKTKTCFTCHGADAKTPILPLYPKLAGQNAEYALAQMQDIKSGTRSNGQSAAMKGVMHLVNDAEMQAIAEYVAGLEP